MRSAEESISAVNWQALLGDRCHKSACSRLLVRERDLSLSSSSSSSIKWRARHLPPHFLYKLWKWQMLRLSNSAATRAVPSIAIGHRAHCLHCTGHIAALPEQCQTVRGGNTCPGTAGPPSPSPKNNHSHSLAISSAAFFVLILAVLLSCTYLVLTLVKLLSWAFDCCVATWTHELDSTKATFYKLPTAGN